MRDDLLDMGTDREMPQVLLGHVGTDALGVVLGAAAFVIMVLMRYDLAARILGVSVLLLCADAGRYAYVLWRGRWKRVTGVIQAGYEKARLADSAKDFVFPGRTQDILLVDDVTGQAYAIAMSRRTKGYRTGMRVEAYLPDGGPEYVRDGIEYTFAYAISRLSGGPAEESVDERKKI